MNYARKAHYQLDRIVDNVDNPRKVHAAVLKLRPLLRPLELQAEENAVLNKARECLAAIADWPAEPYECETVQAIRDKAEETLQELE